MANGRRGRAHGTGDVVARIIGIGSYGPRPGHLPRPIIGVAITRPPSKPGYRKRDRGDDCTSGLKTGPNATAKLRGGEKGAIWADRGPVLGLTARRGGDHSRLTCGATRLAGNDTDSRISPPPGAGPTTCRAVRAALESFNRRNPLDSAALRPRSAAGTYETANANAGPAIRRAAWWDGQPARLEFGAGAARGRAITLFPPGNPGLIAIGQSDTPSPACHHLPPVSADCWFDRRRNASRPRRPRWHD